MRGSDVAHRFQAVESVGTHRPRRVPMPDVRRRHLHLKGHNEIRRIPLPRSQDVAGPLGVARGWGGAPMIGRSTSVSPAARLTSCGRPTANGGASGWRRYRHSSRLSFTRAVSRRDTNSDNAFNRRSMSSAAVPRPKLAHGTVRVAQTGQQRMRTEPSVTHPDAVVVAG